MIRRPSSVNHKPSFCMSCSWLQHVAEKLNVTSASVWVMCRFRSFKFLRFCIENIRLAAVWNIEPKHNKTNNMLICLNNNNKKKIFINFHLCTSFKRARFFNLYLKLPLFPNILCVNNEGSGTTAQMFLNLPCSVPFSHGPAHIWNKFLKICLC